MSDFAYSSEFELNGLSGKQIKIMSSILRGLNSIEIAKQFEISEDELSDEVTDLFAETAVRYRLQFVCKLLVNNRLLKPCTALDELQGAVVADSKIDVAIKDITPRELQVIAGVAEGLSNPEIGERLRISEKTVRHYLTHVFEKLDLKNRVQLALFAREHGLASGNGVSDKRGQ